MFLFLSYLAMMLLTFLLEAVTIKLLWGWFIMTLWVSAPQLGLLSSLGLSFFVGALTINMPTDLDIHLAKKMLEEKSKIRELSKDPWYDVKESISVVMGKYMAAMLTITSILLTGYVTHLFM
jgi:hypothetical protein